jgi:DNA-binding response OmpR family regulator
MLSVLVVEDDNAKYGRVKSVLMQQGVVEEGIVQAISSAAAHKLLRQRQFDMMILDINIPRRDDEGAREDEGVI